MGCGGSAGKSPENASGGSASPNDAKNSAPQEDQIELYYFPFAGRGEVARLCAAAGGLKIVEKPLDPSGDRKDLCKECQAISTAVPLLKHGKLKMCQSTAVQQYICLKGPKFKDAGAKSRAIDAMWFSHVEDLLAEYGKSGIFQHLFGAPTFEKATLTAAVTKWMNHFESQVPETGFIAKNAFPTGADCVIITTFTAAAPWDVFFKLAGVEKSTFKKCNDLAARACAMEGIKQYLMTTKSMSMNPFAALVSAASAGKEATTVTTNAGDKPKLYYFPFAGRGEITRLCAAAGGLELEEEFLDPAAERSALNSECKSIGSGLPVLKHRKLAMCQSTAIQHYICLMCPGFKDLPAQARGIDQMWFHHVEDLLADYGKSGVFAWLFGGPACDADKLKASVQKWMVHFESMVPPEGFIAGNAVPTGADCVILCVFKAAAPWDVFFKVAGVEKETYPKCVALAERVANTKGVKEYLEKSTSMSMNPFAALLEQK